MKDMICSAIADLLPRRLVVHCMIRVMAEYGSKRKMHPRDIDGIAALTEFFPTNREPQLRLVK